MNCQLPNWIKKEKEGPLKVAVTVLYEFVRLHGLTMSGCAISCRETVLDTVIRLGGEKPEKGIRTSDCKIH